MGRRYALSKRDRKEVIGELSSMYPRLRVGKEVVVELYEDRELGRILLFDGVPAFFLYKDKWFPHLKYLLKQGGLAAPCVVVDMGAVKPLLRGADLMAPGIKRVKKGFRAGDPVIVVEEKYEKPFVVGEALVDSDPIVQGSIKRGKVVKNIHRIGDKLWKAF